MRPGLPAPVRGWVPHRIGVLDRARAYIGDGAGAWKATGTEIVEHDLKSGHLS
ncbi:MAG: hypothetical protein HY521_12070 [Proteobacteria bacterium]|nr:hypothetical protein [Pseudomonadota bacterium]